MDDDLDIVDNSLPESGVLTISRGSSAPFSLRLRPRAIGQLTVTVSAVGDRGERDTVRKLLNVKVEIVSVCVHPTKCKKLNGPMNVYLLCLYLWLVCHVHNVQAEALSSLTCSPSLAWLRKI